ncbi:MAG: DMT family transporter [Rubricella sp.]
MDLRALGLGLAFVVMWASAFTSAKIAVAYAPPFLILTVRFLISGFMGVAIAAWLGQRIRLTRAQWIATALFGVCQNTLYLGLNFTAMQWIDASLAAIIASALPITVAAAGFAFGQRLSLLGIAGLVAGAIGVLLVMGDRLSGGADPLGVVLCIAGLGALTVATMVLTNASPGDNKLMVVGLQMLVGAATLLPLSLIFETWEVTWSWQLIVAFTYTTLVPGLLATLTWFVLVDRIGPTRAATFHFLNPFLGVAIAAVILGEALGARDLIGVAIITAGILAVQMARQRG